MAKEMRLQVRKSGNDPIPAEQNTSRGENYPATGSARRLVAAKCHDATYLIIFDHKLRGRNKNNRYNSKDILLPGTSMGAGGTS